MEFKKTYMIAIILNSIVIMVREIINRKIKNIVTIK